MEEWRQRVPTYLRMHGIAIVVACIVGLLTVAPQVVAPQALGVAYKGIPFLVLDDEDLYLARIRDINEGHYLTGSPVFYEYKNVTPLILPVGEYLYSFLTVVLKIPINLVVIISKFLFPALLFFFAYALALSLFEEKGIQSRLTAVSIGLIIVLGYDFVNLNLLQKLLTGSLHWTHVVVWTRLVNPITGAMFLFSYFLLVRSLYSKIRPINILLAGCLLGAMIGYFFSWGYAFAVTVSLMMFAFVFKLNKVARSLLYILCVSLVLQSFYWFYMLQSLFFGIASTSATKNGLLYTHTPLLNKLLIAATLLFIIALVAVKKQKINNLRLATHWQWYASFIVGAWAVLNQQVFTGRAIWPYHFVQYTIPLLYLVILSTLSYALRKRRALWFGIIGCIGGLSLLFGVHSAFSYKYQLPQFKVSQDNEALYQWLDTNAQKECVVLVNEEEEYMSRLIPAFTHCNVYYSTLVFFSVPEDRVLHNYLSSLRLRGVTVDEIPAYLANHILEVHALYYADWHEMFSTTITARSKVMIQNLSQAYAEFMKKDFRAELDRYRIDYVISIQPLTTALIHDLRVAEVGYQGGYHIYQFNRP